MRLALKKSVGGWNTCIDIVCVGSAASYVEDGQRMLDWSSRPSNMEWPQCHDLKTGF